MGTATQECPGGQSRRSSTRRGKRANARRRPRTRPKPKGTATQERPAAQAAAAALSRANAPNARQRAPASTSGRIIPPTRAPGPKQPAPGSGEPRKRLKLRSAMLNYVSCLGMTTSPLPPAKGSTAPNAGKKRFSLGRTPFLLARQKKWGTVFVRLFKAPLTPESGNYSSWWRRAPSSWAGYS